MPRPFPMRCIGTALFTALLPYAAIARGYAGNTGHLSAAFETRSSAKPAHRR